MKTPTNIPSQARGSVKINLELHRAAKRHCDDNGLILKRFFEKAIAAYLKAVIAAEKSVPPT